MLKICKYFSKEYLAIRKSDFFDESYYVKRYFNECGSDPVWHYCTIGWKKGYNPSNCFDTEFYINDNHDVRLEGKNPLFHYLKKGKKEGRSPKNVPYFDYPYIESIQNPFKNTERKELSKISINQLPSNCVLIVLPEHLGDIVAAEPITRYLKLHLNIDNIYWLVKPSYASVIKFNPYLSGYICVESISDIYEVLSQLTKEQKILNLMFNFRKIRKDDPVWINRNSAITFNNYYKDDCLLSTFCSLANLPKIFAEPYFWYDKVSEIANLPQKYVVIHLDSNSSERSLNKEKQKQLIDYFDSNKIHVFRIGGQSKIDSNSLYFNDYSDLRDLQKIAYLIKNCTLFIGVDSSFMHVANCFSRKAVTLQSRMGCYYKYIPYSGNYWKKENISFVYADEDKEISSINIEDIIKAVEASFFE